MRQDSASPEAPCGAQFISTDYPEPNPAFSPYMVRFEKGIVVRINPINGDPSLHGMDLERVCH